MKQARDVLQQFLIKRGLKIEKYNSIFDQWESIAGERIASQSKVRDIVNDTLIIEVYHPGWKQLLQVKQNWIIMKINKLYPNIGIKELKIVITTRPRKNIPVYREKKPVVEETVGDKNEEQNEEGNELERALKKLKKAVEKDIMIEPPQK